MKYFICPEDPDYIPFIEAENINEAKSKKCALCIGSYLDDFECDGLREVSASTAKTS